MALIRESLRSLRGLGPVSAATIQQALKTSEREDCACIVVPKSRRQDGFKEAALLQLVFDHRYLNGPQLWNALLKSSDVIKDLANLPTELEHQGPKELEQVVKRCVNVNLPEPILPLQLSRIMPSFRGQFLSDILPGVVFESPLPEQSSFEIYKKISDVFRKPFNIYVEIGHLFDGEPCMLRYTMRPHEDFDLQWQQVLSLKANAEGRVFREWHMHLEQTCHWASLGLESPSPDFFLVYGTYNQSSLKKNRELDEDAEIVGVALTYSFQRGRCFWSLIPGRGERAADPDFKKRLESFKRQFALVPSRTMVI